MNNGDYEDFSLISSVGQGEFRDKLRLFKVLTNIGIITVDEARRLAGFGKAKNQELGSTMIRDFLEKKAEFENDES